MDDNRYLLGEAFPDGEGGAKEYVVALEENKIPNAQNRVLGQTVAEES